MKDTDEEIDSSETEEEDWIEHVNRSTVTADEKMNAAKIPCWIETHKTMKWCLAIGTASLPDERWAKKPAEWKPGLSIEHQTFRPVGRPRKRWEDEIIDFLKPEETEETKGSETKNNDTWIKEAKHRERWKAMESEYATTAAAAEEVLRKMQSDQHAT